MSPVHIVVQSNGEKHLSIRQSEWTFLQQRFVILGGQPLLALIVGWYHTGTSTQTTLIPR
jgi:hypothetical protein